DVSGHARKQSPPCRSAKKAAFRQVHPTASSRLLSNPTVKDLMLSGSTKVKSFAIMGKRQNRQNPAAPRQVHPTASSGRFCHPMVKNLILGRDTKVP
ncbi:MAG: hypothetical protein WBP95_12845, partial [Acidobacteriaceae bacterium]